MLLPKLLRGLDADRTVTAGTVALSTVTLAVAWLPNYLLWCGLLVIGGAAWLAALTRLNSGQAAVPRWVRARAVAVYLLVFFGGMAAGSVLWGAVADYTGMAWRITASAGADGGWAADGVPLPAPRR